MEKMSFGEIKLIGMSLAERPRMTMANQVLNCGSHPHKFKSGKYAEKISSKINDAIIPVYYEYECDHTKPYSYSIIIFKKIYSMKFF